MRFIVNNLNGPFVRDTFTNTHRQADTLMQAHRECDRLNDYMITHSNYEIVDGFTPITPPSATSQFQFIAAVMQHVDIRV